MQAHCEDLRSEIDSPALADQVAEDWRAAALPAATRAVLAYAEKLTLTPSEMGPEDVTELRDVGLTDEDIHDVVQIASYFNYINRIAAATGVPPEAEMQPWPRRNGEW